jgi:HAD superfamily 5'-nucleotidase-like hydrolase
VHEPIEPFEEHRLDDTSSEDVEQLDLPIEGLPFRAPEAIRVPREERVFVNRNLKMSTIDWLGFDMDYTLAIYNQSAMDALSVDLTVQRLIKKGYPEFLKDLEYDIRFPIRGVIVDKRLGHVLKMDRFKAVYKGYHGMTRLTREYLQAQYHDVKIRPNTSRYHWIDTLFSLCEVTAYSAIVEALERQGVQINYGQLFQDARDSIDGAHREGDVYRMVTADLPRYLDVDPHLAATLHKFRSAGKKLFLLTNSPWHYTDRVMTHLLGNALPEYPNWRLYFDVAICAAQKPHWFHEGRQFLERVGDLLRPVRGSLERGAIYEGGNLEEFERLVGVRGEDVLYIGDHIYGDILRSKKVSSWRTAMIIQELDAEVMAHQQCLQPLARQHELEEAKDRLEDQLRYYQAQLKEYAKSAQGNGHGSAEKQRLKTAIEELRKNAATIDHEHEELHDQIDRVFHPYWGSLLKEGKGLSSFGVQVENYADVYTRRVSSFRHYSPQQYFRSPHDIMPHER